MIDEFKVTFFKRVMMIVGIIIIFLIGLGFGSMGKKTDNQSSGQTTSTKKVKEGHQLTESWVKQFLIAYYTKIKLIKALLLILSLKMLKFI